MAVAGLSVVVIASAALNLGERSDPYEERTWTQERSVEKRRREGTGAASERHPPPDRLVRIALQETPGPQSKAGGQVGAGVVQASARLGTWIATRYGESFAGQPLGCGRGVYDPRALDIVAVGPERDEQMPCGTRLRLCAAPGGATVGGRCLRAYRQDFCPGCRGDHVDVTEAMLAYLAGVRWPAGTPPPVDRLEVTVEALPPSQD